MRVWVVGVAGLAALILAGSSLAEAVPPDSKPALDNGAGDICASNFYPLPAIKANEEGATTLNIYIDETGKPSKADVVTSSGFADLDKAAQDCVLKAWHFQPATKDGKPVAEAGEFRIVWKQMAPLPQSDVPKVTVRMPTLKAGPGNNCAALYYPSSSIENHEEGDTMIRVAINTEGSPTNVDVLKSSGSEALDNATRACVMNGWHFNPAIANGAPIAGLRIYNVRWRLRS